MGLISRSFIDFSEALVTEHLDPSGAAAAKVRTGFYRSIETMPVGGLVENFSRASASADMFKAALQLENIAFGRNSQAPSTWDGGEAKSVLGMIADYNGVPRRAILGDRKTSNRQENTGEKAREISRNTESADGSGEGDSQGKLDV